jgi:hypothetical protein
MVSLLNGAPVTNLDGSINDVNGDGVIDANDDVNGDGTVDENDFGTTDRFREFNGSISSEVVFIFPSAEDPNTCVGDACAPPPVGCVDLFCFPTNFANHPVRTFWTENSLIR